MNVSNGGKKELNKTTKLKEEKKKEERERKTGKVLCGKGGLIFEMQRLLMHQPKKPNPNPPFQIFFFFHFHFHVAIQFLFQVPLHKFVS